MEDPNSENFVLCTVCNEKRECITNKKLTYTTDTMQDSLSRHLGPGNYCDVCTDCRGLVDLIEYLKLQLKLKISELKTVFNNAKRKKGKEAVLSVPGDFPYRSQRRSPCKTCGKQVSFRNLDRHRSLCLGGGTNTVTVQGLECTTTIADASLSVEEQTSVCPRIDVKIKNESQHFKDGPVDKPWKCDQCNKCFMRASDFMNHKRSHTGEKPFQCDQCGATFSQKQNLRTHVRTKHNQEKPYCCELCQKKFTRRRLLDCHINSRHNFIRPYKCGQCEARFAYPGRAKKHAEKSCRALKVLCTLCNKYIVKDLFEAHKCSVEDKAATTKMSASMIKSIPVANIPIAPTPLIKEISVASIPSAGQVIKSIDGTELVPCQISGKTKHNELIFCLPISDANAQMVVCEPDPVNLVIQPKPNEGLQLMHVAEQQVKEVQHVQIFKEDGITMAEEEVSGQCLEVTPSKDTNSSSLQNQFEVESAVFSIVQG